MAADCYMRRRGRQRLVRSSEVKVYEAAGWSVDPTVPQPEPPAKPKAKRKAPAKRKPKAEPKE